MRLTAEEFKARLANRSLTLSLIGMSGMGKSYRSAQLGELGFAHVGCDDLIASRIATLLPSKDVGGLATWMGQPSASGYADRQREYLKLEEAVTAEALEPDSGNRVIDTTGSVIYLSSELLDRLRSESLVVYLEADQAVYTEMFQVFLRDPKPIVWGDAFTHRAGESEQQALARCYPGLLEFRVSRYRELADVVVPYAIARDPTSDGTQFLAAVQHQLATLEYATA